MSLFCSFSRYLPNSCRIELYTLCCTRNGIQQLDSSYTSTDNSSPKCAFYSCHRTWLLLKHAVKKHSFIHLKPQTYRFHKKKKSQFSPPDRLYKWGCRIWTPLVNFIQKPNNSSYNNSLQIYLDEIRHFLRLGSEIWCRLRKNSDFHWKVAVWTALKATICIGGGHVRRRSKGTVLTFKMRPLAPISD